jgi:feruloyl-CoA synthase
VNWAPRYRAVNVGGCVEAAIVERDGGLKVLRSTEPLGNYPKRLTDRLEHWGREAPDRTLVAKRDPTGRWQRISFRQMLERARDVGQALVERGLSAERPVAILSETGVFADLRGLREAAPCAGDDHSRLGVRVHGNRLREGDRRRGG